MNLNELTLAGLPVMWKRLAIWVLLTLTVGYSHGLVFVYYTTGLSPHGVEERYRGNQGAAGVSDESAPTEMKFKKSIAEILNIVHTHVIAMATMFAVSSVLFAMSTTITGFWKRFLLIEPFVAIITSFMAMWLMWQVHPAFSWLLMLSSGSMAVVFYLTVLISMRELVRK